MMVVVVLLLGGGGLRRTLRQTESRVRIAQSKANAGRSPITRSRRIRLQGVVIISRIVPIVVLVVVIIVLAKTRRSCAGRGLELVTHKVIVPRISGVQLRGIIVVIIIRRGRVLMVD